MLGLSIFVITIANITLRSPRSDELFELYQMKVTVVIGVLALLPDERCGKVGYEAVAYHS
jgi:hypothetical protein